MQVKKLTFLKGAWYLKGKYFLMFLVTTVINVKQLFVNAYFQLLLMSQEPRGSITFYTTCIACLQILSFKISLKTHLIFYEMFY